eukprot:ANDGO_06308.mRNA.1 hypothetical protein CAOG_03582
MVSKCAICYTLMSVWAIIMLVILASLMLNHSVIFHDVDDLEKKAEGCFLAALYYAITLVVSGTCWMVSARREKQREALEARKMQYSQGRQS